MANSNSTQAIEELASDIGTNVYIEVAKWHLYLADAHLHRTLAEQVYPLLKSQSVSSAAITKILQTLTVPLGGGKAQISLADLIPATAQTTLLQILETAQEDYA